MLLKRRDKFARSQSFQRLYLVAVLVLIEKTVSVELANDMQVDRLFVRVEAWGQVVLWPMAVLAGNTLLRGILIGLAKLRLRLEVGGRL